MAFQLQPDVITLDLEMPKMDGFTFLRLLMARQPTPVIVISGYATSENVFKALELGALDFVAKPSRTITPELRNIQEELLAKVRMVTQLRMVSLADRAARTRSTGTMSGAFAVAAVAGAAAVVAQGGCGAAAAHRHRRVDGRAAGDQSHPGQPRSDAADGHRHHAAHAGQVHQGVRRAARPHHAVARARGGGMATPSSPAACWWRRAVARCRCGAQNATSVKVDIVPQQPDDRYVPSVDRMLSSAAEAMGRDLCGIVLTGMGGDGGRGVKAVRAAGGRTVAEAPETAVIFGMPQEAIATGAVDEVVALGNIPERIAAFVLKK